jgi:hypothetical protein
MAVLNIDRWRNSLSVNDMTGIVSKYLGCGYCPAKKICHIKNSNDFECELILERWGHEGSTRGRPRKVSAPPTM